MRSNWSIIVPSGSDANLLEFIPNLMEVQPDLMIEPSRIVVVSDGLSDSTRSALAEVTWIEGARPFNFARSVNRGVAATADCDIVICGDDVRFYSDQKGIIDRLSDLARFNTAIIAPEVAGVCGQPAQRISSPDGSANWVAFICVYIPRQSWNAVGPLDERFTGYGYDDVDWCLRSRRAGEIRIDHGSRVFHADQSVWRKERDWQPLYIENRRIFEEKWSISP